MEALTPLATTLGSAGCVLISTPSVLLDELFLPFLRFTSQIQLVLKEAASLDLSAVSCHDEFPGAWLASNVVAAVSPRKVGPAHFPRKCGSQHLDHL